MSSDKESGWMPSGNVGKALFCMLYGFILYVVAEAIGMAEGKREVRREAVRLGHAEWVVTNYTGKTEFKWKDGK